MYSLINFYIERFYLVLFITDLGKVCGMLVYDDLFRSNTMNITLVVLASRGRKSLETEGVGKAPDP